MGWSVWSGEGGQFAPDYPGQLDRFLQLASAGIGGQVRQEYSRSAHLLTVSKDVPNGKYVASFINTNNGDGDGISIKLGKAKSAYTLPAGPDTLSSAQNSEIRKLLSCDFSLLQKGGFLANIALTGILEDLKFV